MKKNFSRLPSRKGVQAGASEPNCLDVESKFHSLWSAMERQVGEGIEVSRWIDKLLSFDGRLTGSEALISLSPREKVLRRLLRDSDWNPCGEKDDQVALRISLLVHGKIKLEVFPTEEKVDYLREDEIGYRTVFYPDLSQAVERELESCQSSSISISRRVSLVIKEYHQRGELARRVRSVNQALREIPPVCCYWNGEAVQNFREPRSLPSQQDCSAHVLDFTEEEVLGPVTARVLYFFWACELLKAGGPNSLETLNGQDLGSVTKRRLPQGLENEKCRRIEGVTRRKIVSEVDITNSAEGDTNPSKLCEDREYTLAGFVELASETIEQIKFQTRSDVVMTRGFREIGALRKALDEGTIEELSRFDMYSHYCWVLGGDRHTEDELHAISSRMRYNSWHLQPWGNTSPAEMCSMRYHPATLPDISSNLDFHHTGHIRYSVRHAIRAPYSLSHGGEQLLGFGDIRAMRQSGERYTDEDLMNCVTASRRMGEYLSALLEQSSVTEFSAESCRLPESLGDRIANGC